MKFARQLDITSINKIHLYIDILATEYEKTNYKNNTNYKSNIKTLLNKSASDTTYYKTLLRKIRYINIKLMNEMVQYYKDINSSQKSTDLIQSQSKP